jgi:hypothetical protein
VESVDKFFICVLGKKIMFRQKPVPSIIFKFPLFNIGLILSLGLTALNPGILLASSFKKTEVTQQPASTQPKTVDLAQGRRSQSPLSDGIYLYGQSDKPEQIGQEYLVFKVTQGRVVGAFYLPQSEFNCFSGTLDSRRMNLSVIDPYDQTASPYSIALQELSPVASTNDSRFVGLEGYQPVETISDNDRRILSVCLDRDR